MLAALAVLTALAAPVHAQTAEVRSLPLSALSPSGAERTLDWRGWRSTMRFVLPAGLEAQNLRIVLTAVPGETEPAPHASLSVSLNGSPPAILHPEPYPFSAQLDFPAQHLRPGENVAEIAFLSPEGDCPNPRDGAWTLDLAGSHMEVSARPPAPATADELTLLLGSPLFHPRVIAIQTPDLDAAAQARLQVWAALAMAVHMPQTPRFALNGEGAADLAVAFDLRPEIDEAWLELGSAAAPVLTVHAPDAAAAAAKLEDYARSTESQARFPLPEFEPGWRPEPAEATFTLDARPVRSALRMQFERHADAASGSELDIWLNGHPLRASPTRVDRRLSIALPAHLLQPGRNRLRFAPELAPVETAELCPAGLQGSYLRISDMRLNHGMDASRPTLFGFAAGAFEADADADLALPAASPAERAAQLRLLAGVARKAGRAPRLGAILAAIPSADAQAPLIVLAPRTALPETLLDRAPESFGLALRGPSSQDQRFQMGPRAFAAAALPATPAIPVVGGAATRFPLGDASEEAASTITILTQSAGADFPVTLDALIDQDLLAGFDGRVTRWTATDVFVQDRGPWRPRAGPVVPPPNPLELQRTLLFLCLVGGLTMAWLLARRQRLRR